MLVGSIFAAGAATRAQMHQNTGESALWPCDMAACLRLHPQKDTPATKRVPMFLGSGKPVQPYFKVSHDAALSDKVEDE